MPYTFDVVCVGDAKIDTFLTLHEANDCLRLNKETNELCIKFGDKITVDKAEILLGGNAANVSVGISRLGLNATILAEIGRDAFAPKIINTLKSENVDTSNIQETQGQQSSFSTILNFKGERTIFSEHVKRMHNFNFEDISTKWVYLTSLGEYWKEAYVKTVEFVKKTQSLLAFNPGTLQVQNGKNSIQNVLSSTNLLLVNKEESEYILGLSAGQKPIEQLLRELQKLGPKIVVITDGENGSFAIDTQGLLLKKDIVKIEVIERTGAGDAYSSGFLSALTYNKSIVDAMEWGKRNAASVIGKVGATAGLLHRSDLENV
jgi:sugar/nucleoside kinase (ribokinase family)